MRCCCCYFISREYFSRAIKVILPKIVFDFTVGKLSKNVKILSRGSMTFVCNKGTQGGGLQKRNIYHICIFDHQKQELGISHTWRNKYVQKLKNFYEKVIICPLYFTIFTHK